MVIVRWFVAFLWWPNSRLFHDVVQVLTSCFIAGHFLGATSKKPAELEVCYINDAAFDDDTVKEEDEDNDDENGAQQFGPEEANLGQDPEPSEPAQFPRSKSDWEAFRNPSLLSAAQEPIRNRFDSILTFQYL